MNDPMRDNAVYKGDDFNRSRRSEITAWAWGCVVICAVVAVAVL